MIPFPHRSSLPVLPPVCALVVLFFLTGCPKTIMEPQSEVQTSQSLSPSLLAALTQFNRGAALLEQYQYSQAAHAFQEVLMQAPDWVAAHFNLGLALLNMQGESGAEDSLAQARQEFELVLAADPQNISAQFCLGLLYQHLGQHEQAKTYFISAHQADPRDPHVLYKVAESLLALNEQEEGIRALEQVVELDPGFVSALYRLAIQYQRTDRRDQAKPLFNRFRELKSEELAAGSFTVSKTYGTVGKYYLAHGADNLPLPRQAPSVKRILFSPDVVQVGASTTAWTRDTGPLLLPGIAAGDIDLDGDIDLCLTAQDDRGSTTLWLNDGTGHFAQSTVLTDRGLCPTLGDIDNDDDLDLWLGRAGPDLYFVNDGTGHFSPLESALPSTQAGFSPGCRLLDIDSDGDLDLLSLQQTQGAIPAQAVAHPATLKLFNNNRDGSFLDISDKLALSQHTPSIAGIVYDDFDNDRDLDLVVLGTDGRTTSCWINDRAWQFRPIDSTTTRLSLDESITSAITGDPDNDGNRDLLVFTDQGMHLFINQGSWRFRLHPEFEARFGKTSASGGQFADMDNDGDLDIVIADALRPGGRRGPTLLVNRGIDDFIDVQTLDPGNLLGALESDGLASCLVGDFTGNGCCDCLWAPMGQPPTLLHNLTNGGHWLQIDLQGKRGQDRKSRSNNSAIGARLDIKAGQLSLQVTVGGSSGPVATGPLRVHVGLGSQTKVDWLRITWPDAVLQAELELPANQTLAIMEIQRKISSCPHLFGWNGHGFELISDFGGMGGMGYLAEPGLYPTPDPTEYVPIPNLMKKEGLYVLQVVEPIEEAVYFDEAKLLAVDHPIGTEVAPNEMMAVTGPAPAFELYPYRDRIEPLHVTDQHGNDVTQAVTHVDRVYAGATRLDEHFVGFAEEHVVEFDFGDRLQDLRPEDRLVLFIQGWVHYSYSSVNFAAAQAHKRLEAPTVSVFREGHWQTLFQEIGYPAGLRHMMTLEVTGKLQPTDRRLRISSNMELYYDRIFLAPLLETGLHVQEVPVSEADLHFLGYPREVSPDGRQPHLYDYESVDRTLPWKTMSGRYTRYGDVTELMHAADDCYAIMGPGDELTLVFDPAAFTPVPAGMTRSFILKTDSYCKDMDLYTATPDTLAPLPFHGMSRYPYDANESYPQDAQHEAYQQKFNTRDVTGQLWRP